MFEIDDVGDSFRSCGLDENDVTSVVIRGHRKVPSVTRMLTPRLASVWFDVELYSTAHGSEWHAVVVKVAVVVRVCGDVGRHMRLSEEIQSKYNLWYQLVPLMDWEVVRYAGQSCNEMALVCLNRAFRCAYACPLVSSQHDIRLPELPLKIPQVLCCQERANWGR